jgi:hypothetical protein
MWTLVFGVIALVVAVIGARPVGRALKVRPIPWFVGANVLIVLVALATIVASSMTASPLNTTTSDALYGVGLGLGFGGLAGLRYGYKGLFEVTAVKNRS